jgi:hypothetical protein
MGQAPVKGKSGVQLQLSKNVQESLKDLELQRLDLGSKNVYISHFDLVDVSQYTSITWLNVSFFFIILELTFSFPTISCMNFLLCCVHFIHLKPFVLVVMQSLSFLLKLVN